MIMIADKKRANMKAARNMDVPMASLSSASLPKDSPTKIAVTKSS